ncbi:reverse transcriptase domain-containing protein [Tanacetum coccineum]|uniref:Reverse transcriptase domain-containing protein n=1 Tax=Tanacetum coccineum TaxID=301880 RepID=A0ABQ5BFN5_9ASTR
MLKRCEDTNLSLNWEKSHFMVKEGISVSIPLNTLKRKLTEADLIAPTGTLPFQNESAMLATSHLGAVLGQEKKNKQFQPIALCYQTMNEAQTHYTTTEKELLAVVYDPSCLRSSDQVIRLVFLGKSFRHSQSLHSGPTRGHYGANYTAKKASIQDSIWPTIYKDAHRRCHPLCNNFVNVKRKITQRDEMHKLHPSLAKSLTTGH